VPLYSDQGIVLRSTRLGESDRIVTLLTQSHGKVRAVVKGVRKTTSRFGGRLEPFSHVDLLMYEGRGELHIVSQAELIDAFAGLRHDFDAYAVAQVICEGADRTATEGEPNVRLVLLVLAGLRALAAHVEHGRPVPRTLRAAYLLKLLGVSGFGPTLNMCVACGGDSGLTGFSITDGGVVCGSCRRPPDPLVQPGTIELFRYMWCTPLADIVEPASWSGEADVLVNRTVEYHLDRHFRSLELCPF
jgi:DNA repair protein RecO (recombination protein O)